LVIFERLREAIDAERPVALVTCIDGPFIGGKLLVDFTDAAGELGPPSLRDACVAEARALLVLGETATRSFGTEGEPTGDDVRVFIQSFAPRPVMYIFGAIDFSRAMATMGKFLGYRVVVIDARPVFATKERIPDADEIIVEWPDEFLARAPVDPRTAIVVLTHDVKFDIPLLEVALRTDASYIGVMGSRKTHANRVAALRERGIDDRALARLCAPTGLDIAARTPEETALSIAAEIIAVRNRRTGGQLRDSVSAIH
jgi:xanthine dehydrogenase accessory factor